MAKLYDELNKIPNPEETLENLWNKYAYLISPLPTEHVTNLYVIIYHCSILEGCDVTKGKKILPYGGKNIDSGRGALYVIENLSHDTQMLLIKYLMTIHEEIQ